MAIPARRFDRTRWLRCSAFVLSLLMAQMLAPPEAGADQKAADWWSEHFEVHGFLTSKAYFRSPSFDSSVEMSSWRHELNLEAQLDFYQGPRPSGWSPSSPRGLRRHPWKSALNPLRTPSFPVR